MPTFTDAKRERVRESLRNTGRELFARHGIRKTTISELTEAVGIGHGTFYQFYDSKEDLYIDILKAESEEFFPRILDAFEAHNDPEEAIGALLDTAMKNIESNPLIQRIIVKNELDRVRIHASDDEQEGTQNEEYSKIGYFSPHIEQWYDNGRVVGPDPETIAHAIRSVAYLTLHIEEIGKDRYPAVRNTVIAAIAAGLTDGTELMEGDHE